MNPKINRIIRGKRILVLGFGKEGESSVRFIQRFFPDCDINIADRNKNLKLDSKEFSGCNFILGENYLSFLNDFDLIIKSPGIPLKNLENLVDFSKITSQTEIFLQLFRDQTIGITGTKGKSTTSSLIFHMLNKSGKASLLVGNIGVPPLDLVSQIKQDTLVVFEMSSHQLDGILQSPKYAVFLNLYEEHLDHYKRKEDYRKAKNNIFKFQKIDDWLIFNADDKVLFNDIKAMNIPSRKFIFSGSTIDSNGIFIHDINKIRITKASETLDFDFALRKSIHGRHNLFNVMAAVSIGEVVGLDKKIIESAVLDFTGLEHRLEYVGKFKEIHFYNDSIATIPEATIEAVKTLGFVDTLILGGKDRGISYSGLLSFLTTDKVRSVILTGEVGLKLQETLEKPEQNYPAVFSIDKFEELGQIILEITPQEGICLLSPSASSYDMFNNFEHRGIEFKKIAKNL